MKEHETQNDEAYKAYLRDLLAEAQADKEAGRVYTIAHGDLHDEIKRRREARQPAGDQPQRIMAEVQYTAAALLDLDRIESQLAEYSTDLASRVFVELDDTFKNLAEMPLIGRTRKELREDIRSLVHKRGYTILYSLIDNGVLIERVTFPRQGIEGMLEE